LTAVAAAVVVGSGIINPTVVLFVWFVVVYRYQEESRMYRWAEKHRRLPDLDSLQVLLQPRQSCVRNIASKLSHSVILNGCDGFAHINSTTLWFSPLSC
jgi:hypothetical protein